MILTRDRKEVIAIYKRDGSEVDEVKDANGRLVYTNTREITGTLPLSFSSRGKPLSDYRISGNTVQDGTPTPEAPVDVVGCGVRTEQLFEDKIVMCNIDAAGRLVKNSSFSMYIAKVEQGVTYTASASITGGFFITKPTLGSTSYNGNRIVYAPQTITAPITGYMVFRVDISMDEPMLNTGSTALPYEPYGYKLPLTVNGTESPIYLGEAQTTRKIKKLVLTGEEDWVYSSSGGKKRVFMYVFDKALTSTAKCSHFVALETYQSYPDSGAFVINYTSATQTMLFGVTDTPIASESDFKSYLAAQYANGNPVTVWYVLAEPETAVVNEPLMKISDYADTISMSQAGVTIPTVQGTNVLDMVSPVKPSEVYVKGKGIRAIT